MRTYMKRNIVTVLLLAVAVLSMTEFNVSALADTPTDKGCTLSENTLSKNSLNNPDKVLAVIGDSRCCSIEALLWEDKDWEKVYTSFEGKICDGIYRKNNQILVICAEGGGSYLDGAAKSAWCRMNALLENAPCLQNCVTYKFADMFGVNDINEGSKTPKALLALDKQIAQTGKFSEVTQYNVGPVSNVGAAVTAQLNNVLIDSFNAKFKKSKEVKIVNLNAFLQQAGYGFEDDAGVHYDEDTSKKILMLLLPEEF